MTTSVASRQLPLLGGAGLGAQAVGEKADHGGRRQSKRASQAKLNGT